MGIIIFSFKNKSLSNMVLVTKENRRVIFEYLLKEGVVVVKKDAYLPAHQQIPCANLHVMMIVKSLKSRSCLNEVYNWGWSYYFLTNEGVAYLIKELGLPADAEIVPATHTKKETTVIKRDVKEGKETEDGEEKPTKGEDM